MKKLLLLIVCSLIISTITAQNWKEVKAGSEFSLGIKDNGTLWSWGFNGNGQLGGSDFSYEESPVQIGSDTDWQSISAGGFHALALKKDGTLWGWGLNVVGQVTGETEENYYEPVQIGTDADWIAVEACYASSFAMKRDSTLWAWGYNEMGQLGVGDSIDKSTPTRISAARWKSISAGGFFVLAIKDDHTLWQWGLNIVYQESGSFETTIDSEPVQVGIDKDWEAVSAGLEHVIALKKDGTMWILGNNLNGQLGIDTITYANEFVQLTTEKDWVRIETGSYFSFAINKQGELYAWGNNLYGQLGIYTGDDMIPIPTKIFNDGMETSQIIPAKGSAMGGAGLGLHTLLLKNNKSTFCAAGANYIGQLGLGNLTNTPSSSFTCYNTSSTIHNTAQLSGISVFPNPAKSYFTVTHVENANLILYNSLGQKMLERNRANTEETIQTNNLPNGMYFLEVEKGNTKTSRKILIAR